jgi:hypothetical protein
MITDKSNRTVWNNFYEGKVYNNKNLFQYDSPSYILTNTTYNKPFWGLRSPNQKYYFGNSNDGKVVIYDGSTPIWSSNAAGAAGPLIFQSDGNLVLYSGTPLAIGPYMWGTGTTTNNVALIPFKLSITDEGELKITNSAGTMLWGTNLIGACDNDGIYGSFGALLKTNPSSDTNITAVTDEKFQNWFIDAVGIQKLSNNGSKYVSIWPNGGYRSYATCPTVTRTTRQVEGNNNLVRTHNIEGVASNRFSPKEGTNENKVCNNNQTF